MAENKKAVLLYCDIIHTIEELSDEEAGVFFKHYLRYINDKNPEPPDKITKLVFEPIKQQLKRDLKTWNELKITRSENGKLGGINSGVSRRLKQTKQMLQKRSKRSKCFKNEANEAVTVTVTDTVTDTVILEDNTDSGSYLFIENNNNADGKEKNKDFKEILNPSSFPTWRAECSAFLKDEYFKQNFCKDQQLPMGNLEEIMREFVKKLNLENDFKNAAGLKVHFTRHYKKHVIGKEYTAFSHSKGFIDVPDHLDYDNMETW